MPRILATVLPGLLIGVLGLVPPAQAMPSAANYTVRPLCSAAAPGYVSCLGLRLAPRPGSSTPDARALLRSARALRSRGVSPSTAPTAGASPAKVTLVLPEDLHSAYGLPTEAAEPQTIAIVDAYDDPHAEADLGVYDQHFKLPACTQANGCFTKVNQQGQSAPLPPANGEWSAEIATDIEVAHSVCQNCHIVLVEAGSITFSALEEAEDTAASRIQAASKPGSLEGEISNSWGGQEPLADSPAYNHPGIVITASAGDAGYLNWGQYSTRNQEGSPYFNGPDYPASSPHVIAVGGTSLTVGAQGEWTSEEVWNDSGGAGGGGCSAVFPASIWQLPAASWPAVGCGSMRAVADISADADPYTGVAVYDSVPEGLGTSKEKPSEAPPEWIIIGGTSVASPIVASAFALGGGAHGVPYPAATLYAHAGTAALHDITAGGNGECKGKYNTGCSGSLASPLDCGSLATICNAATGYDGPTGVGTPTGLAAFQPISGEIGGGGSGEGSGGGGPGGREGGSTVPGSGGGAASPGGQPPPAPGGGPSPGESSTGGATVRISSLSLTLSAVAALNRGHPRASSLIFTFALSAISMVHVTLAKRVRVGSRWRWTALPGSFTIRAGVGANHGRLSARRRLTPGRYRLTLTPAHGVARSITIVVG